MQVDPMNPMLKSPGTKHLKLNCDRPLSTSAFKFDLRRYIEAMEDVPRPLQAERAAGQLVARLVKQDDCVAMILPR